LNTVYEENTTKIKTANLLLVGGLNVIGKTEEELQKQIQTFKNSTDVIYMEFGFGSCVKIVFTKGNLV